MYDFISEDMKKLYPDLVKYAHITVYDVADKVLPMFDESLAKYAMDNFRREGISIKTNHHVQELREGPPRIQGSQSDVQDHACFTLKLKEEGEVGVGMVVWSKFPR